MTPPGLTLNLEGTFDSSEFPSEERDHLIALGSHQRERERLIALGSHQRERERERERENI